MSAQGSLHCWLIFIVRIACMQLLLLVWRQYRWPFIAVMALSLASAALGIGLIAFINVRLIEMVDTSLSVLPEFLGLLLLLRPVREQCQRAHQPCADDAFQEVLYRNPHQV